MAILYSGINDGYIRETDTTNFANARDATTGVYAGVATTRYAAVVSAARYFARGGGFSWDIYRAFFQFDTSGISIAPSSANLMIFGYYGTATSSDFFVVKSEQSATLANADFDAITGWSAGADNEGNVTKYSSEITSWTGSAFNTIALNAAALSDMASLSTFKICLINSVNDLRNVDPGGGGGIYINGCYFADFSGASRDPKIDYTAAVAAKQNATFFGTNF